MKGKRGQNKYYNHIRVEMYSRSHGKIAITFLRSNGGKKR